MSLFAEPPCWPLVPCSETDRVWLVSASLCPIDYKGLRACRQFSCLCLPSHYGSVGITYVHILASLCGFQGSNSYLGLLSKYFNLLSHLPLLPHPYCFFLRASFYSPGWVHSCFIHPDAGIQAHHNTQAHHWLIVNHVYVSSMEQSVKQNRLFFEVQSPQDCSHIC